MNSNLKAKRQAAGLSQAALAAKAGVNLRVLQYYEQGYKDINQAAAITVYALAQALGCPVEELLQLPENE